MSEMDSRQLEIRAVTKDEKEVIDDIVSIHLATFQGFFLTFMGRGFLRQMYSCYCENSESSLLVAFYEGKAAGFLASSENMSGLYKFMIKKRLIFFAWYSFGAFLRKPAVFMRLVRAFLKPGEAKRQEPYIELASIGVSPEKKSMGIGTQLIAALKDRVDFTQYAYIALETDAVDNDAANHFYQKNGFLLERVYITNEGRKMNEYRYRRAVQTE